MTAIEMTEHYEGETLNTYQTARHITYEPDKAAGHIAERLSKAVLAVEGRIPLRGQNQRQNFKFATSEDIKTAARAALADNGLSLVMGMVGPPSVAPPTKGFSGWDMYTVEYEIMIIAPEGVMRVPYFALALDNSDKGLAKTLTTGMKYFLITLLQIPRGDEPDADATEIKDEKTKSTTGGNGRQAATGSTSQRESGSSVSGSSVSGPSWPSDTIDAIRELGIMEDFDAKEVIKFLNKHATKVGPGDGADVVALWVKYCHEGRGQGMSVADAVEFADKSMVADKFIEEHAGELPEEKPEPKEEPEDS
jgi:hypothetical protein